MEMLKTLQAALNELHWSSLYVALALIDKDSELVNNSEFGSFHAYIYPNGNMWAADYYGATVLLMLDDMTWEIRSCGGHWVSWNGTQYRTDILPSLISWGDSELLPEEILNARETRLQKALNNL